MKSFRGLAVFALLMLVSILPAAGQNVYHFIPATACTFTPTTTALTVAPLMVSAASGNPVMQITTNTTGGTIAVTCPIKVDGFLNGVTKVYEVDFLYGVQTTAWSAIGAPTINKVLYPIPGTTTPLGTVTATAGGTLAITPASLQLATTTTGLCYSERIVFGTPYTLNYREQLTLQQTFTNSAATTVGQFCGIAIRTVNQ